MLKWENNLLPLLHYKKQEYRSEKPYEFLYSNVPAYPKGRPLQN